MSLNRVIDLVATWVDVRDWFRFYFIAKLTIVSDWVSDMDLMFYFYINIFKNLYLLNALIDLVGT